MSDTVTREAIQALRASTQAAHQKLDSMLPIGHADATLADYALHLAVLQDWQAALAPWLSRVLDNTNDLELLAQDLADCRALGCPPPESLAGSGVEDAEEVTQADDGSEAFCWGIAYVLEGSKLGGQLLHKRLGARLAPHPLRYFATRPQHGPGWPEFLKRLEQRLPDDGSRRSACAGAVAAFGALSTGFEHAGQMA